MWAFEKSNLNRYLQFFQDIHNLNIFNLKFKFNSVLFNLIPIPEIRKFTSSKKEKKSYQ